MREILKKRPVILFWGILLVLSATTFTVLVLYWPQNNPHSMVKVVIESGSSLNGIANMLNEKKIISNKQMFCWAVKIMGKEKKYPSAVSVLSMLELIMKS